MKRLIRKLSFVRLAPLVWILSFIFTFLSFERGVWSAQTQAKRASYKKIILRLENRNGDYLNHVAAPAQPKELREEIFGNKVGGELGERYKRITEVYDHKRNYQLEDWNDHYQYQSNSKDLAKWAMRRLVQYHLQNTFKSSVKNASKNSSQVKSVTSSMTSMHNTFQSLQNTAVKINPDIKARFKYDLPSGMATVGLSNPIVETTVNYRAFGMNTNFTNPATGIRAIDDANNQNDRLNLAMSRTLDFLGDINTNMNYGIGAQRLNYGVNRQVYGPVNASLDQTQNLKDPTMNETIGRVNLGTQF